MESVAEKIKGKYFDIEVGTDVRYIDAKRGKWEMDNKGYFLIKIDYGQQKIVIAHCDASNKMTMVIKGKTPLEIYYTISEHGLIGRQDHACYLGGELAKAYIAMKQGLKYVQDEDLDFNLKV